MTGTISNKIGKRLREEERTAEVKKANTTWENR